MRLFVPLCLLFAAGTFAADYKTVLDDLDKLDASLTTLSNDVKDVVSGVPGLPIALQVQVDAVNLDKVLLRAIENVNASPDFGIIGSPSVSLKLVALAPKITSTIGAVGGKSKEFGDFGPIVLASLYQLRQDTSTFADGVVDRLDPLYAAVAPIIVNAIDSSFNGAIGKYGG
ncbi:hypothetical protein VTO42DRAFT_1903 [Malbranchea cinnamomea]